jgi:MFS family permease
MYSSTTLAYIVLAIFGDFLGRKRFVQIGMIMVLAGMAITIFSVNLLMGSLGMLICCFGCEWIYTTSLLFISETVDEKHKDHFLVVSQMFYGIGHLGNAGFYFWLKDWQSVFIYCYAIPAILILFSLTFFTVDTPICLINLLSPNKARKALYWVAKVNGKKDFFITLD